MSQGLRNGLLDCIERRQKHLPDQVEELNVEYVLKWKAEKEASLAKQIRCFENFYIMLGVMVDGVIVGLYKSDYEESIEAIKIFADSISSCILIECIKTSRRPELFCAEIKLAHNCVERDTERSVILATFGSSEKQIISELVDDNNDEMITISENHIVYLKRSEGALTSWCSPSWICICCSLEDIIDDILEKITLLIILNYSFFIIIDDKDKVESEIFSWIIKIQEYIVEISKRYDRIAIAPISILKSSSGTAIREHFGRLWGRKSLHLQSFFLDGRFCGNHLDAIYQKSKSKKAIKIYGNVDEGSNLFYLKEGEFISCESFSEMNAEDGSLIAAQISKECPKHTPVTEIEADLFWLGGQMEFDCPFTASLSWMDQKQKIEIVQITQYYGENSIRLSIKLEQPTLLLPTTRMIIAVEDKNILAGFPHIELLAE